LSKDDFYTGIVETRVIKTLVLSHALRAGGGRVVGVNTINCLKNSEDGKRYYFIVPDQPEYRALRLEDGPHSVYYYRRFLSHLGRWSFEAFPLQSIRRPFHPDAILGLGNLGIDNPPCPQAILLHHPYIVYDAKNTGQLSLVDRLKFYFLKAYFRRRLHVTDLV